MESNNPILRVIQNISKILHWYIQDTINLLVRHFQPQLGKPKLWKLDSDQHNNVGRHAHDLIDERASLNIKRSLSDDNAICENYIPLNMH